MDKVFEQLQFFRGFTLENLQKLEKEHADIQPTGFSNTLRWNYAHILTAYEGLVFQLSGNGSHLDSKYMQLFSQGTRPSEWTMEAPSLEEIADEMPAGYKNTIRWNLGHIIAVLDAFLFNFDGIPMYLSAEHFEMFKSGSKPADWATTPPSLEDLTLMFKGQMEHIKKHLENRSFEEKTKNLFKIYGNPQETLGEVLNFCQYHEGFHLGYINGRTTETIKRALI